MQVQRQRCPRLNSAMATPPTDISSELLLRASERQATKTLPSHQQVLTPRHWQAGGNLLLETLGQKKAHQLKEYHPFLPQPIRSLTTSDLQNPDTSLGLKAAQHTSSKMLYVLQQGLGAKQKTTSSQSQEPPAKAALADHQVLYPYVKNKPAAINSSTTARQSHGI